MNIEERINYLIQNNQKVAAIKEYREHYGTSLKESKDHIDKISESLGSELNHKLESTSHSEFEGAANCPERVRQLIAEGKKVQAVREYQKFTGVSLSDAKAYVDTYDYSLLERKSDSSKSPAKVLLLIIIIAAALFLVWMYL